MSSLNPMTAILPLLFVLFTSILREGYEDYYRHKSDDSINSSECNLVSNKKVSKQKWKDV